MSTRKVMWTEDDISSLKGQEESIRLEFKAGALFDKSKDSWASDLSKEVSAFANTEGGVVIVGLREEKRAKLRVAGEIDGAPDSIATDQLQRIIEDRISPLIREVRVHRVPIVALPGRVVFVIDVPQGNTAYQADDCKYYGRSEFEIKPLRDREIRLRMERGKVVRASVNFQLCSTTSGAAKEVELRQEHSTVIEALKTNPTEAARHYYKEILDLGAARFERDVVEFELVLRNDGELTIREPAVHLHEECSDKLIEQGHSPGMPSTIEMPGETVYPGDQRSIKGSGRKFPYKRDEILTAGDYTVRWKVFLDNSSPSEGELDLGLCIEGNRTWRHEE